MLSRLNQPSSLRCEALQWVQGAKCPSQHAILLTIPRQAYLQHGKLSCTQTAQKSRLVVRQSCLCSKVHSLIMGLHYLSLLNGMMVIILAQCIKSKAMTDLPRSSLIKTYESVWMKVKPSPRRSRKERLEREGSEYLSVNSIMFCLWGSLWCLQATATVHLQGELIRYWKSGYWTESEWDLLIDSILSSTSSTTSFLPKVRGRSSPPRHLGVNEQAVLCSAQCWPELLCNTCTGPLWNFIDCWVVHVLQLLQCYYVQS